MAATDLAILVLLVVGLVLSIIELGISAYLVHSLNSFSYYDPRTGQTYRSGRSPSQINFLVFCSVWGMLVAIVLLAIPYAMRGGRNGRTLGFGSLILNTITMIFWLAGFAAYSAAIAGLTPLGIYGALMAFAVMPWLVWLALTIINFLTAFGVLRSSRPEHDGFLRRGGHSSTLGTKTPHMTTNV